MTVRIERVKFKPLTGKNHGILLQYHSLDDLNHALSLLAAVQYEGLWGFEVDVVYRTLKITTSLPTIADHLCELFKGQEWPSTVEQERPIE